jgi:signal transduction histidine kinase
MTFRNIADPERLHALIDAMVLIESNLDLDALLERVVEEAARLVGARYGALGVLTNDGASLARFITYGVTREQRLAIGELPHGHGVLGETIERRAPLRIAHLVEHPGNVTTSGLPAAHPSMDRFLGVPVATGDGRIYGNLYLTDPLSGDEFSSDDEALIEAFGRAAGLLIDQAQLRDHARELTLREERDRLARDLHDTVVQRMFGVGLSLQTALNSVEPGPLFDRITQAVDDLDATIREIRTTIFEIDRATPDSLSATIRALCHEVSSRLGLAVTVTLADSLDMKVAPDAGVQLVRALREVLSNVVRHAHASRVDVEVATEGASVELRVVDDGIGFSEQSSVGKGLRNLDARAREYGGTCHVDSLPGEGTTVHWSANRQD